MEGDNPSLLPLNNEGFTLTFTKDESGVVTVTPNDKGGQLLQGGHNDSYQSNKLLFGRETDGEKRRQRMHDVHGV